jgi:predicted DCC family thiol-disulfide oxidoreductase YuxK
MSALRFPLTVFYDASCPLCAKEMHALKERDADGKLELVDCSAEDFDEAVLSGTMVKRSHLMTYLHARDAHGRWLVGVDAFREIYGAAGLPRLGRAWLHLRRVYPWIARNRQLLSRLAMSYCSSSQCSSRTRPTTVKRESPSGRTTAISPSAR